MSQITIEMVSDNVFIARVYTDGIDAVEPEPYKYAVTIVKNGRFGEVKGASGLDLDRCELGAALGAFKQLNIGIDVLCWRHKMRWHIYG